ncbi:MAG: ATP-binding cassette domain-containing protein [Sulfurospirillum sp.]|nr:ATP-binding cassette domain-containing protein [Sulfurospirillum sp.]
MIEIDIQKSFKNKNEQINFHFKTTIENNSINAIFGQSGSGKTTFLRLLSGLETPDIGYIKVNDKISRVRSHGGRCARRLLQLAPELPARTFRCLVPGPLPRPPDHRLYGTGRLGRGGLGRHPGSGGDLPG